MKSILVIAAAAALCAPAFATGAHHVQHAQKKQGVAATVKQDAHKIGSAFRRDMHRIARGEPFRHQQMEDQRRSHASAMGAGPADGHGMSARQARMDAAYAEWQRKQR